MSTKQKIQLPLEHVQKTLRYLDLEYVKKRLPDGYGVQLRLDNDGFEHVNINVYNTHTVVVQPMQGPEAIFVRRMLAMRARKLRRLRKI